MNPTSESNWDAMRRGHYLLRSGAILICAASMLLPAGCASHRKMRQDVTRHFREQAILKPYVNSRMFNAQPQLTAGVLVEELMAQGAQLLCWDEQASVVSWCDTSGHLVPLPIAADKVRMPGFDDLDVSTWNGYVYGCARSVAAEKGSWLVIYVRGRDMGEGRRIFSDGTYERRLLGSVDRAIHQIATGQRLAPEAARWKRSPSRNRAETYTDLFMARFANLPGITAQSVTATSPGMQYPVEVERLWIACLDVVTQYDLVPYVNSVERIVVFSRHVSVPSDVNSVYLTPVDTVMAVSVETQGEGSCTMHVAVLEVQDLRPRCVSQPSADYSEGIVTELAGTPFETASVMVSTELERHIDLQLLYNENWGNKLLRHMSQ